VGYRYYDTVGQEVLYPFGHGLSYTTYEYRDLQLSDDQISDRDTLTVTLKVRNAGEVQGQETVQLYVRDVESSIFRPDKELKGFAKVDLKHGEETEIAIALNKRAFAYYSTDLKNWHVESGEFEILVGASSRDIRLKDTVDVISSQPTMPSVDQKKLAAYTNFLKDVPVSKQDFEALLGRSVPQNQGQVKGQYDMNTPIGDMVDSFIARQLYGFLKKQMGKIFEGQEDTPMRLFMDALSRELPLRSLLMMDDGSLTREMVEALLVMINGKFFKGASALIRAVRNK